MTKITFKLHNSCLFCEKEISMKEAIKGRLICSKKCLKEINKMLNKEYHYTLDEVVNKGKK